MGLAILGNLIGLMVCILTMETESFWGDVFAVVFILGCILCVYKVWLDEKRRENDERCRWRD